MRIPEFGRLWARDIGRLTMPLRADPQEGVVYGGREAATVTLITKYIGGTACAFAARDLEFRKETQFLSTR